MVTFWTEARVAELHRLSRTHSAGQIACLWGVTRNKVMGKLHREGLIGNIKPRKRKNPNGISYRGRGSLIGSSLDGDFSVGGGFE